MNHLSGILYVLAFIFGLGFGLLFLRVLGAVAARLLGVRLPWWRLLLAASLGSSVGASFAEAIGADHMANWGGPLIFFSLILVATMIFSIAIELLVLAGSSGEAQGRSTGIPHPIRSVRRLFARWIRYLQITAIITRYG